MKGSKALNEIHEIMEKIHADDKGLSAEMRVAKMREESDRFLRDRGLTLKRVKPKTAKHTAA